MGCNFCSTSAMFGGKGKFIEFYKTGDELFEIMCALETNLHVRGFFVMDENFLFNQQAGVAAAGVDGKARQVLVPGSLQLRQRAAAIHDGTTGRPGGELGVAGLGGKGLAGTPNSRASIRWR